MLRFLIFVLGAAILSYGVYRSTAGTQESLRRGASRLAVQVWAISVLVMSLGIALLVIALTWTLVWVLGGLLLGIVIALAAGALLFRSMVRKVQGRS